MKRQSIAEQTLEKVNRSITGQMAQLDQESLRLKTKWDTLFVIRQQNEQEITRLRTARETNGRRNAK
jgi:hypothetical protein